MIVIQYDPINGKAIPDGGVPLYVDAALATAREFNPDNPELYLLVGSHLIIDEFRLRIVRDELPHNHVLFKFIGWDNNEYEITCNEYGKLSEWPKDFCDQTSNILMAIAYKRRKEKENG